MAVRSARLAGPIAVTGGAAAVSIFTVPIGQTFLVKWVAAVRQSGSTGWIELFVDGSTSGDRLLRSGDISGTASLNQEVWLVFHETETCYVSATTVTAVVSLHGAALQGSAV